MVERDKDSLKASLARSLLHTTQLTEELDASQSLNHKLQLRNKELEDALEKVEVFSLALERSLALCSQYVNIIYILYKVLLNTFTFLLVSYLTRTHG